MLENFNTVLFKLKGQTSDMVNCAYGGDIFTGLNAMNSLRSFIAH